MPRLWPASRARDERAASFKTVSAGLEFDQGRFESAQPERANGIDSTGSQPDVFALEQCVAIRLLGRLERRADERWPTPRALRW